MSPLSVTDVSLLERVRNSQDQVAWSEFVELYGPLIYAYGRKRGLQDADAADLAQDVLRIASEKMQSFEYSSARGSFRGWLLTVTLNRLRQSARNNHLIGERGTGRTSVINLLQQQAIPQQEDHWEQLSQQQIFRWASEQIRPEFKDVTWRAFQLTAVDQVPVADVAAELGISVGSIYIARSRVISRLRQKVATINFE